MSIADAIERRLEVREYSDRPVDDETKRRILDAGRLAPSGKNLQHWRFILLDDPADLESLADRSPTGSWVADAAFAVVVCTDPSYDYHEIDAGRAITHLQFAAYDAGVGSCIYTVGDDAVRDLLDIPVEYDLTAVAAFGYPTGSLEGRKDRKPLDEVAFSGRFGRLITDGEDRG